MQETKDYNSIRSLAYVFPAMILIMALRVGISAFTATPKGGYHWVTLFHAGGTVPLAFQMLEYLLAVICFVNLYRLAETSIWIDVSNTMFLCYMMAGILLRISEWIDYRVDPEGVAQIGLLFAGELPMAFVLLGVLFLLLGMGRIYKKIRENSAKVQKQLKRIGLLWGIGVFFLIVAELLLEIFVLRGIPTKIGLIRGSAVVFSVLFLALSVPFCLKLRSFCMEYYMYCYNMRR